MTMEHVVVVVVVAEMVPLATIVVQEMEIVNASCI